MILNRNVLFSGGVLGFAGTLSHLALGSPEVGLCVGSLVVAATFFDKVGPDQAQLIMTEDARTSEDEEVLR